MNPFDAMGAGWTNYGSTGGYADGTGNEDNPISIGGVVVNPKTSSSAPTNFWGQLIGIIPGAIGAFTGNQQPQSVTNVTNTGSAAQPQRANTLLYIGLGLFGLVIVVLLLKKK